jgi:small neutral amino acid transporter SnatA (MarC family)
VNAFSTVRFFGGAGRGRTGQGQRRVRAARTPLLAGPGATVATMLFVRRAQTGPELAAFLAAILAATVVLWLVMRFSIGHG